MPFAIISKLRQTSPDDRAVLIKDLYAKNRRFFKKKYKNIHGFLENSSCPYRIDLTQDFFNIIHEESNELAHPPEGLDLYAEMLGSWIHEAWQDIMNLEVLGPLGHEKHIEAIRSFDQPMNEKFPERQEFFTKGAINLKILPDGRRFSPPVVFVGIFHGLHIAQYLQHTEISDIFLVEPEPDKFELSCYFLDYEAIESRFGLLRLHLGSELDEDVLQDFFAYNRVTTHMWIRALPAYASKAVSSVIEELKVRLTYSSDLIFPLDRYLCGLKNADRNVQEGLPVLSDYPKLSEKCQIALVATGPSLDDNIAWLQENRKNVIIFAVHSSVRTLQAHGIKPDFQFSIETDLSIEMINRLHFYRDVPLIGYNKTGGEILTAVDTLFLCGERNSANPVDFTCLLEHTYPSTTNLAFSFAIRCQPQTIYLLGCDLGYRSTARHHANAAMPKNPQGQSQERAKMMVPANFPKNGPVVQTESLFYQALMQLERILQTQEATGIKVYNLADGARINGAVARRCDQLKRLSPYKNKAADCQAIRDAFQPAVKGVNYKAYSLSGTKMLKGFQKSFMELLYLEKFTWVSFFRVLDTALGDALIEIGQVSGNDYRMEIYVKLLHDLLGIWYLYIILYDDICVAERVYREGYRVLADVVATLEWPMKLDDTNCDS